MTNGSKVAKDTTFTPKTGANDITITVAGDDVVNKAEADKATVPVAVKVAPKMVKLLQVLKLPSITKNTQQKKQLTVIMLPKLRLLTSKPIKINTLMPKLP
ncbi:hypothetical protein AO366_1548 [Moraxella catarrhalis]|nr:hypothetical protein AO366_1548 [Moraxella catarrhalis]